MDGLYENLCMAQILGIFAIIAKNAANEGCRLKTWNRNIHGLKKEGERSIFLALKKDHRQC